MIKQIFIALGLSAVTVTAHAAGPYIGGSIGQSDIDQDPFDTATSFLLDTILANTSVQKLVIKS